MTQSILIVLGALFVVVGFFMGKDSRKDTLFALGGTLLLIYGVKVDNALYIVLAALFTILSVVHMGARGKKR